MCVIALVENARPSDAQVMNMWDQNPKGGGGAAWRETIAGEAVVKWRKGLDKEDMLKLNTSLPVPYVLHFRQPSHDTSDSLLACHPFQIDEDATSGFQGTFNGYVLFHNGYWAEWRKKLEALAIAAIGTPGFKGLPSGAWSDSRGLAWATHYLKFGFLEMVNEKVICFGPRELDIEMFGGPWLYVKAGSTESETFIVSNKTWERGYTVNDHRSHTRENTSKLLAAAEEAIRPKGKSGGTSQQTSFPTTHGGASGTAGAAGNQQEQVQKSHQGSVRGSAAGAEGTLAPWQDGQKRSCTGCGKHTSAGTIISQQWFCYQCWAAQPHDSDDIAQRIVNGRCWVGTCERCRVGSSGMKTVLGDEWLCHSCWETNGKPKIYYARERGPGKHSDQVAP